MTPLVIFNCLLWAFSESPISAIMSTMELTLCTSRWKEIVETSSEYICPWLQHKTLASGHDSLPPLTCWMMCCVSQLCKTNFNISLVCRSINRTTSLWNLGRKLWCHSKALHGYMPKIIWTPYMPWNYPHALLDQFFWRTTSYPCALANLVKDSQYGSL